MDLIESLSRTMCQEKAQGRQRPRMLNVSRIREVAARTDDVEVTVEFLPTGERAHLASDLLVYATGYRPRGIASNLGRVAELCPCDDKDDLLAATTAWRPRRTSPPTSTFRAAPSTPTA